jgi:hypothetical protein
MKIDIFRIVTLVCLCWIDGIHAQTNIATINTASTSGAVSEGQVSFSLQADVSTGLSTRSEVELQAIIRPPTEHTGLPADLYAVIAINNYYYLLQSDGSFQSWNGSLDTLAPAQTRTPLGENTTLQLLDGQVQTVGTLLFFVAYSLTDSNDLHFTPEPAQLLINSAPDGEELARSDVIESEFESEIESRVIQSRCIFCHVDGGVAQGTSLRFERAGTDSALRNLESLTAFIKRNGAELVLTKVTGGAGHGGQVQLAPDSADFIVFKDIVNNIADSAGSTTYTFANSVPVQSGANSAKSTFLSEVTLEPLQATLRRATLLLQGRLPTASEQQATQTEDSLRSTVRSLMQGPAFREFIVTSVNDRLLTQGSDTPLNMAYQNFLKLHNKKARDALNDEDNTVHDDVENALKRASGELVAYVIENDLPYSEILTADYMMMNPVLNTWLEGSATFSPSEGNTIFKPAVIQGYYTRDALEVVEFHENSNSIFRSIGSPVQDYPHAGLLNDLGFISRYPTTATNRNRARARWTFFHFLGVDIEKSAQRPTDEASLSDQNNPTMYNPNCTVCHAVLDPVAAAFQNWDEDNFYRGNGEDGLDGFYKYPQDGADSLYEQGDLWYRDMRPPGLFGTAILEKDNTLQALAKIIVEDPLFLPASAAFWWSPVFGKPLLDNPTVETDANYAELVTAYQAQQSALTDFATALAVRKNAKDMLVEMIVSPWFAAESTMSLEFDGAHFVSRFGGEQLLTPEQLARKTRALTGVAWRTQKSPSGDFFSVYDDLAVLLGGIDSEAVTSRAIELTPVMTAIFLTHATETACIAVARQFATPTKERSLLSLVEESTLPRLIGSVTDVVPSEKYNDRKEIIIDAELKPGPIKISLLFTNPYCDWNGSECLEQRKLYVHMLNMWSPSGKKVSIPGNDPRMEPEYNDRGNQSCYQHEGGAVCFWGALHYNFIAEEQGNYRIEAIMSAEVAPSQDEYSEARIIVSSNQPILTANTENAARIRNQISLLYQKLHGKDYAPDSDQVNTAYEIFTAAILSDEANTDGSAWEFENCAIWGDGFFYEDIFSAEQVAGFRTVGDNGWWQVDWDILGPLLRDITTDDYRSKYAWTAVMMYMLSHYDFLHE